MNIEQTLTLHVVTAIETLYATQVSADQISLQKTKREFEGDITLVVFPFLKISQKRPDVTAQEIGAYLAQHSELVTAYSVIQGFLNLTIAHQAWIAQLWDINADSDFGFEAVHSEAPLAMVEYSSPNTNKPLHLGHVRNNLLGYSLCRILSASGYRVVKTNIVNDRGIHICKSMLAWQKWGDGVTPDSSAKKGDHLVGDFYVAFDKHYKAELADLMATGLTKEQAESASTLMQEARQMLIKWEQGDCDVVALWQMMNSWVYAGFDQTYKRLGVDFDRIYYESTTYLDGKNKVMEGLSKGVFNKREDGSVWADLSTDGLDEKLLLRADGTSVYMTQDIGTAAQRYQDYDINKMIYVVGNEQNYHFQVLSILLDKLGFSFGKSLVHFSYGMVELPEGKMKSREGTVVDADDLMDEMINTARETSEQLGKLDELDPVEATEIIRKIGLGALKYFILKVDPRKNMVFNPAESIDFNGNTGPFIQYTYARIQSILRRADQSLNRLIPCSDIELTDKEIALIQSMAAFGAVVKQAALDYSPAIVANYVYDLSKEYNQFYHDHSILSVEQEPVKEFRLILSRNVGLIIEKAMGLLGIEMPERM